MTDAVRRLSNRRAVLLSSAPPRERNPRTTATGQRAKDGVRNKEAMHLPPTRDALEGGTAPHPPPSQGAQPMPSHCLPDGKCQLQWHL